VAAAALWALALSAFAQQAQGIVKEIRVTGNVKVSREAILAAMRTKVGQVFSMETLDRDKDALYSLGFFDTVDLQPIPLQGNDWRIDVLVSEFPEVKELRIVGNTVIATDDILKVIRPFIKPGDVFNITTRRPASAAIQNLYAKKGYSEQVVDFAPLKDSPHTINIQVQETRIGKVTVVGAKTTKAWVFKRLIKSKAGDPYSVTKWEDDLRRLKNTQWFEEVKWPEDTTSTDPSRVNLIAQVKEQRTGQFNVGLQLDPENSLAGIIRLSDTNFEGTGQSVSVNFLQSIQGDGPSVDLNYANPFIDNAGTRFNFSIYSRLEFLFNNQLALASQAISGPNQLNVRRTGFQTGFSRPISNRVSVGLSGRLENIVTNNTQTTLSNQFIEQDGYLGVLTGGLVVNRRDRDIDATHGDWLKITEEPGWADITQVGGAAALPGLVGDHDYLRSQIEYRAYFTDQGPIGHDFEASRRVLALRLKAGTISGIVPYSEQFFVGGSDSLRGYYEQRFWGRNMLLGTAEMRFPLQSSFSLIFFVDYGDAWGGYGAVNNYTQTANMNLHVGYGPGLSFRTPLGNIRIDLGFDDHGHSVTNFEIGTTF
jgi:outer membrane protein insertion porin family